MIFFDGTHLATDGDIQELHNFAESVRMNRSWFREKGTDLLKVPHYYVHGAFNGAVLDKEVIPCPTNILLAHCDPKPPHVI
jgi:hypothetical protein